MKPSARTALALGLILLVYAALFARTRRFDFVWADFDAIRDSPVYDLPLGQELRTTEHARMNASLLELRGIVPLHESYRPLLILSHGLDIELFGRVPGPMHVVNVLWGALAILAAFWLAARLFAAPEPALLVAAIFAWHPLHVEPICFISSRGDPMAGALALVAAALVVEMAPAGRAARGGGARLGLAAAAGLTMLLSLFTKEASVLMPVVLLGFGLATGRLRAWGAGIAATAAAVPAYAALRAVLVAHAPAATHANRVVQAVLALPAIVTEYARSFLLPFDMSISRPLYVPLALGWAVLALLMAIYLLALRRAPASWRPDVALSAAGVACAGLLFAPSAIAVFSEDAVADRYAYLPLFGFAVALVALGTRAARSRPLRRWAAGFAAVFVVLCVFVTAREIPAWASSGALYAHAVDVEPQSAAAHSSLGRWLGETGAWADAVTEFEKAAALPDAADRVLNNLGASYLHVGRPREAEAALRRALDRSHGSNFHAWYNLGTAQRALGQDAASCLSYRRALAIVPDYAHARADLTRYCPGPPAPAP